MYQVKIFTSADSGSLETKVNEWLKTKSPNVTVEKILYSKGGNNSSVLLYYYTKG